MPDDEGPRWVRAVKRNRVYLGLAFAVVLLGLVADAASVPGRLRDAWNDWFQDPVAVVTLVEDRPAAFLGSRPDWEPFEYFFTRSPADVGQPPERCMDRREWAAGLDGVDTYETWVVVTLANRGEGQVTVAGLAPAVREDIAAPEGFVAGCPVGGASMEPSGLIVDLAAGSLVLQPAPAQGETSEPVTDPVITIEPGAQEVVTVRARAPEGRLVTWHIAGTYTTGGDRHDLVIDDDGKDFRTVGSGSAAVLVWDGGWVPLVP